MSRNPFAADELPPGSVSRALRYGLIPTGGCVRARHMKTIIESVDALGPLFARHIRARVLPESLHTIEEAPPSVWLPLALNLELTLVIAHVLGKSRTHTFFRTMVLREDETSLFKSFIATFSRVMGITPATYIKMTPKGWALVFRDCGHFAPLDRGERDARLLFDRIPQACLQGELWLESIRSSFYSAFDISGVNGAIEWGELDLARGRAVFVFRWQPRS